MNIDERLEKLTERQDALTQSVELLTHMHRDNEIRYQKMEKRFERILTVIEQLANLAANHDSRISNLERGTT